MNYSKIFIFFFLITSCNSISPGMNYSPTNSGFVPAKEKSNSFYSQSSIDAQNLSYKNISVAMHNINEMLVQTMNGLNENSSSYEKLPDDITNLLRYEYKYVIGPGDIISFKMTELGDVDGAYIVNPEGLISVPYAGDLLIQDKTKDEAQKYINEILRKYYKNPEVIINIDEYRSSYAYINGAVKAPQAILLSESPVKLIDFILRANPNPNSETAAFNTRVIIRRDNKVYKIDTGKLKEQKYDLNNLYLKKNDVIFVERNKDGIYVFGEVGRPGLYVPHNNYSITELLANAGISQLTANPKKIFIIRENLDKFLHVDVYKVDVSNPVNLVTARNFYLKPNDIVFMPAKGIAKWNRVVSLLTPSTDLFKAYNPVIQEGVASQENATSDQIRY